MTMSTKSLIMLNRFVYSLTGPIRRSFFGTRPQMAVNLKSRKNLKPEKSTRIRSRVMDGEDVSYEFIEGGDKRFGQVIIAAKSRKEREKNRIILLEGRRLILDGLEAGLTMKCVYFTEVDILKGFPLNLLNDNLYRVQYRQMKLWSDLDTPPGIMGIFEMPKEGESMTHTGKRLPVTIVCDNIRDPGNLGTLVRTSAAVGCARVITTKGCVDVWDAKVLRAGMGSHFHIPIHNNVLWQALPNHLAEKSQIYIADTHYNVVKKQNLYFKRQNKGNISNSQNRAAASAESQNSLMYEQNSHNQDLHNPDSHNEDIDNFQDTNSEESKSSEVPDSDTDSDSSDVDSESDSEMEESKSDEHLEMSLGGVLPESLYHQIKYADSDIALIIGGETHGVSRDALRLAHLHYGQYATIPLSPGINSLNSAISASVILYEIQRQLAKY